MSVGYFAQGTKIKLEVDVIPPYLSFWGEIQAEEDDMLLIEIEGNYAQNEERWAKCTIPIKSKAAVFDTVIKKADGNYLYLKKPDIAGIELVQRRKFIRVSTEIPVVCYLIGIHDKKVESHKYFPGIVKDISGGGVLLNTPMTLPVGTVLVFELELEQNKLLLTSKILREPKEAEDGTREYGCEFIGLDESDLQKIVAYCSKMQVISSRREG